MNPEVGFQDSLINKFSVSKCRHFHKNIHSWIDIRIEQALFNVVFKTDYINHKWLVYDR